MRRLLYWYLPVTAAVAGAAVFGAGLWWYFTGNVGSNVTVPTQAAVTTRAPRGTIVPIILGDSLARGTGDDTGLGIGGRLNDELAKRQIQAKKTVNLAVNGARTADLMQQLSHPSVRTLLGESNVVIISIGGNDLWGGTDWRNAPPKDPEATMTTVLNRMADAVKVVRTANPRARIFIIGLYNPFVATPFGPQLSALVNRWNARLVERFGSDPNLTVVQTSDLFAYHDRLSLDRFHPGAEGYALIARRIADAI